MDDGEVKENVLTVEFPHSAVLFLRSSADTPERMRTRIDTPGGSVSYDIVVIKLQRYSIDEIFDKNLLFLIPFYIFSHESRFKKYENDSTMLEALMLEYESIRVHLENLAERRQIDEYTKCTILDMSGKVLEHIAANHQKVREGVKSVMGGQVLDYEAKRIRNEGIEHGLERGEAIKLIEMVCKKMQKEKTVEEIADSLEESEETIERIYQVALKYHANVEEKEKIYEELGDKELR